MRKAELKKIVKEGLSRGKNYMCVKILEVGKIDPIIVVIPSESIEARLNKYLRSTDEGLIFNDTGDHIEDVLLTSNLNDLSWFVY